MKAARRFSLVPLLLFPVLFFTVLTTAAQAQAAAQAPAQAPAPAQARPWQVITVPSTAEVAANFDLSAARVWGDAAVPELERRGPGRCAAEDLLRPGPDGGERHLHDQPFAGAARYGPRRAGVPFAGPHGPGEVHRGRAGQAQHADVDPGRERLSERICRRIYHGALPAAWDAGHCGGHYGACGAGTDATDAGARGHAGDLGDGDGRRPGRSSR